MREVLCRGKTKDGVWVEGFLFKTKEHTYIAYAEQYDDDLFLSPKNIFIEVIPETVGLYTGTTDARTGKKIFEDDIVVSTYARRLSNRPHLVKFSPISGYCYCDPKRKPVVIGNIHDNPDILKGA